MRRSDDFAAVLRSGTRVRRGSLVVSLNPELTVGSPALVGLVVGRAVGNSVVRHRVSRRLRAQLSLRVDAFEAGSGTVVRALPDAARADSEALGRDLDAALTRLRASR